MTAFPNEPGKEVKDTEDEEDIDGEDEENCLFAAVQTVQHSRVRMFTLTPTAAVVGEEGGRTDDDILKIIVSKTSLMDSTLKFVRNPRDPR